jgi:hypothetical protein
MHKPRYVECVLLARIICYVVQRLCVFFPLGAPQQSPEKFPVALVEAFFYLLLGTSIVQVDFVQNYLTSHETIQIDFSFQ